MSVKPEVSAMPPSVLDEHRGLLRLVEQISAAMANPSRVPEHWRGLVKQLQKELVDHFQHEESGGYFRDEVKAAPWAAEKVKALLNQHAQFLERIAELLTLRLDKGGEDLAPKLFEAFRRDFLDHESRENALIQETSCHDFGLGD